jgi:flagellar basal body-associated protein FliL
LKGKGFSFLILLVVVAFLTMIFAGVLFYLRITSDYSKGNNSEKASSIAMPGDDELSSRVLFDKEILNLKRTSSDKSDAVRVSAVIKYYKSVKGIDVEKKLDAHIDEIKEMAGTYFQQLTLKQIEDPNSKDKIKKDLTKESNILLNSNEKTKNEIVYTIIFSEFFYQ